MRIVISFFMSNKSLSIAPATCQVPCGEHLVPGGADKYDTFLVVNNLTKSNREYLIPVLSTFKFTEGRSESAYMPLNPEERNALDGIKSMLSEDVRLGLSFHDKDPYNKAFEAERGYQHLHGNIQDMFNVKIAELPRQFQDGVSQAFSKVHSYKYIDDPSFVTAMNSELVSQGIPAEVRAESVKIVDRILNTLQKDSLDWEERSSGFNPDLDEVVTAGVPDAQEDFDIEDDGGLNDRNVEAKVGDASPGHTGEE